MYINLYSILLNDEQLPAFSNLCNDIIIRYANLDDLILIKIDSIYLNLMIKNPGLTLDIK